MRKKMFGYIAPVFCAALFIAGCFAGKDGAKERQDDLFTVKVLTQSEPNELFLAHELGYFEEEGIRIEFVGAAPRGVTQFQLVAQGEIDVFVGHPPLIAKAREAGILVKGTAPQLVDDPVLPHIRYFVRDESPIGSLDDINGHTIAIAAQDVCMDGYLKYYLKNKGLSYDDIEWVNLPGGQQEQSLSEGLIDMTTSHPPWSGRALKMEGFRQIGTTWDIFASPGAGLSVRGFSDEFISRNPDVVKAFGTALWRARVFINKNPEEALKIGASALSLDPDELTVFKYEDGKTINPAYIDQWVQVAEFIDAWNTGAVPPQDVYTNDYAPD
jgi:ABC-type nitrate/sulfonate/bicarbonate transport system substrate-binding protein